MEVYILRNHKIRGLIFFFEVVVTVVYVCYLLREREKEDGRGRRDEFGFVLCVVGINFPFSFSFYFSTLGFCGFFAPGGGDVCIGLGEI